MPSLRSFLSTGVRAPLSQVQAELPQQPKDREPDTQRDKPEDSSSPAITESAVPIGLVSYCRIFSAVRPTYRAQTLGRQNQLDISE